MQNESPAIIFMSRYIDLPRSLMDPMAALLLALTVGMVDVKEALVDVVCSIVPTTFTPFNET